MLRAIEGARSALTTIDPLWTMPGHLAQHGRLTHSVTYLVDSARHSVICSTFNFQRSSGLWQALRQAAQRPEISMKVYIDTRAADSERQRGWSPTTDEVAAHLKPAIVLRTKSFDGRQIRNHSKFICVDHRFLLVTSANFSWSAENGNLEFGVLIDNRNLAESVERELRDAEDLLFERVPATSASGRFAGHLEASERLPRKRGTACSPQVCGKHLAHVGSPEFPLLGARLAAEEQALVLCQLVEPEASVIGVQVIDDR